MCDGHGSYGHQVSLLVSDKLCQHVKESKLNQHAALKEAFTKIMLDLLDHKIKPHIDLRYSGTTVVTVLMHDKYLHCANLGDSRAVLASRVPK